MNCPDCKTIQMKIDFVDFPADRSFFEVVFKCLRCGATFFGSIYRDEKQALTNTNCEKCEEKKDALRSYERVKKGDRLLQSRPFTKAL